MFEQDLRRFITESNKIEGIHSLISVHEVADYQDFLSSDATIEDLQQLVSATAGPSHHLRDEIGLNVRVGSYRPPPGGPHIRTELAALLAQKHTTTPHALHVAYEDLHPFTDGNGRSGRALWLWMMQRRSEADRRMAERLGFLHLFYYQTLQASSHRRGITSEQAA